MRIWMKALLVTSFVMTAQAALSAQPSLESGTVIEAAERLKAGEFLWAPEIAPEGPVLVVINRTTQRLVVYRNGIPIGISTVSTGRPGYSTPTGVFTILQKHVEHYSNLYNNAPMPYMQRLTWRGVALHAGELPGYPASHGCIRLPREFARLLYGVTRVGMTVVVTDQASLPRVAPTPNVLLSGGGGIGAPASGPVTWRPEISPTGPVSILISGADRRLVVLRNGRVIGSGPIEIDGSVSRTDAYILRSVDGSGQHWLRVPLPGQDPNRPTSPEERQRFRLDPELRQAIRSILLPGTTVIITGDSLQTASGSEEITVLEESADSD